ncbi:MAG TPA: glycosyltransferase family 39 protein [Candidatus Binatia bacterium]|nr:glycosyltransferase family 39 protein [Candidatus Binatia bacterium]
MSDSARRGRDLALLLALVVAGAAVVERASPIGTHGEAREALVVRDIVRTGRWVLPRRSGALPSKPPLFHWVAAALARVAGLSDASVRAASVLAAGAVAATTWLLGEACGGRRAAWLAAGALLGMGPFWGAATEARVDMVFVACLTLALGGFSAWYRAAAGGAGAAGPRVLCYLGAAAAVLAKGPAGGVLVGLPILGFLAWAGRLDLLARLWSWGLAAVVLAIDGGWYALAAREGGMAFLRLQFVQENFDALVARRDYALHAQGNLFRHARLGMAAVLAVKYLPWSLVLPVAAWRGLRRERTDDAGRFLHAWWLAVLGTFTLALGNKRPVYILPLAPAIALLAAREIAGPSVRHASLVTVLVVLVDVVALGGTRADRVHLARRESLADFAAEVARAVPAGAPLHVTPDVWPTDVMILDWRLGRDLAAGRARCDGGYVVLPEAGLAPLARRGWSPLVASRRTRPPQLALARAPADCADR